MNGETGGVTARHWTSREDGAAECRLCPHRCVLKEGKTGVCMVKKNVGGRLVATAYGHTTAFNMDPIEKKPLYHFYPGTQILSVGPNACNFACRFCQNYHISQQDAPTRYISPRDLALAAREAGSLGVAYTYTEPLMWYEYILDAAREVRALGMKNVLVTNGHLEPGPYDELLPLIDALNVDVKSMDEDFYRKICRGKLAPVLRNVAATAGRAHIEITNLVIPGLNDTDGHFERLADFMAHVDPFMPLHFSRYHPMYKMTNPATPRATLLRAAELASRRLKYVFIGNVGVTEYNDTHCPFCGALLISRAGYEGDPLGVKNGRCLACGEPVRIIS